MKNDDILFYEGEDRNLRIKTIIENDDVWLNQKQLAELYGVSTPTINEHIKNVFEQTEQNPEQCIRKFRIVVENGRMYNVEHYNLDMIISVGYRVNSEVAIGFRRWATERLHEYMVKGFTLDDKRLKQDGGRYFKELLQRIRDIRSSERNLWQQVTDIYATSIDYDKNAKATREFFATVQNKLHYAVHRQTAAEVIYNRVDANKPMIGMTNFEGDYITKEDTHIAKNYLDEKELTRLNLLVGRFLDYAELMAMDEKAMRMQDWKDRLDFEIKSSERPLLNDNGKISREKAMKKADTEYDKYRKKELAGYESDFDRAIEELNKKVKKIDKSSNGGSML